MQISMNDEQLRLVTELVDSRIGDLRSEIRRTRTYVYHDQLRHDLECLQELLPRLRSAEESLQGQEAR